MARPCDAPVGGLHDHCALSCNSQVKFEKVQKTIKGKGSKSHAERLKDWVYLTLKGTSKDIPLSWYLIYCFECLPPSPDYETRAV